MHYFLIINAVGFSLNIIRDYISVLTRSLSIFTLFYFVEVFAIQRAKFL